MNKYLYLSNELEHRHNGKIFESSFDKEQDGIQFLWIGDTTAQLLPLLKHCKFFVKCVFILMLYTDSENIGLWDCSWFLQIDSQLTR